MFFFLRIHGSNESYFALDPLDPHSGFDTWIRIDPQIKNTEETKGFQVIEKSGKSGF